MPNSRRRRFSVQNEIASRQPAKIQNGHSSKIEADNALQTVNALVAPKSTKSKNKICGNSSKNSSTVDILSKCDSVTLSIPIKELKVSQSNFGHKDTLYSKSINPEYEACTDNNSLIDQLNEHVSTPTEPQRRERSRHINRDITPLRREKHVHQHRMKVRSPRRRVIIQEQGKPTDILNTVIITCSTATSPINWEEECEMYSCENVTNVVEHSTEDDERPSTHSMDDMCRICHGGDSLCPELGRLISACLCRGTVGRVHVKCLERWLTESGKSRCELCGTRYETRRVHRYGVLRALVMWILSQNAKQLMVDSLGIMLMSPLAVLAAWLSGRTLAGLMTQESEVAPWPLASTFVLACMTLVCYYCWIVSAATRHALGWWIWYRSQYEVRLTSQGNEN